MGFQDACLTKSFSEVNGDNGHQALIETAKLGWWHIMVLDPDTGKFGAGTNASFPIRQVIELPNSARPVKLTFTR